MKSAYSPKAKKIVASKMTSPDRHVVTGNTEKQIKQTSSKVLSTAAGLKKPVTSQTSIKKIIANPDKQPKSKSLNKTSNHKKVIIEELRLVYEGGMVDGRFDGLGTLYDESSGNLDKYIYKGDWKNGSRQGHGHYIYPDKTQYIGDWLNNLKSGRGIYKNNLGQQYEGQWLNNERYGEGKLTLSNGTVLEGRWENDQFKQGNATYPNKSTFEGALKDYERNGKGIYSHGKYSDKYDGEYSNNVKEGFGKYYFSNGDVYEGGFHDNQKQGRNCRYVWSSGRYQLIDAEFIRNKLVSGTIFDKTQGKSVKII